MKTIANCTPKEFAAQTVKIAETISLYIDALRDVRAKLPKLPENATAEDIRKAGTENFVSILKWCMDANADVTMELCGSFCFMSGDEFANLDPAEGEDGIAALFDVLCSERCLRFFDMLLHAKSFMQKL